MAEINIKQITCAGFVMRTPEDKIILVRTEKYYSFPKGKFEKAKDGWEKTVESLFKCAIRELVEETNMFGYDFITTTNIDHAYIENNTLLYFPALITKYHDDFEIKFKPNSEIESLEFLSIDELTRLTNIKNERRKFAIDHANNPIANIRSILTTQQTINHGISFEKQEQPARPNKPNKPNKPANSDQDSQDKIKHTRISKKLSYFLRHHLDEIPGKVTNEGYVMLDNLLSMEDFKGITEADVDEIVLTNDKQRFKTTIIGDKKYIRANQGHSAQMENYIDEEKLYKLITTPFDYCAHGTTRKNMKVISQSGLKKMDRTHIHFASSPDAISGFRQSSQILIHIDMGAAMNDGIKFYLSDNNVILSQGPIDKKYFKQIEEV